MPNRCSAPGCKSNYDSEETFSVFQMPKQPDGLRHSWLRALHREDVGDLKTVYVCSKHFKEGDIEYTHRLPNGDGTYREIPRKHLKLKEGAVPSILPGCLAYYPTQPTTKRRRRFSSQTKDDELLSQAMFLSLMSNTEENEKFQITSIQDLQVKYLFLLFLKHGQFGIVTTNRTTIIDKHLV